MSINNKRIYTVIVTYNRKELLNRCIKAILNQSRPPDQILIVDNASTDGTNEMLQSEGWSSSDKIELLRLSDNLGGAGGFSRGIQYAIDSGADFIWIMDDDAIPANDALQNLLEHASDDSHLYGSLAVDGHALSWRLTHLDDQQKEKKELHYTSDVPVVAEVQFLPFLGMMISKKLVEHIGLPDEEYFLAADDVEFCLRTQKAGFKVFVVGSSKLHHPAAEMYDLNLLVKKLSCLKLSPWKRYYDVRNRLLLSKKHFGIGFYLKTIPGSIVRYIGSLIYEKNRGLQTKAFFAGMLDGLLGKKGRRHTLWGL
ncbi:glycosyltransferase family 2 protein [Desulfosediminicola flagellatus]|uniref:glycosyltransferase family 2 protein n=1 Tax=Desulfosediminicola flagellatus TaxID=2569541 RepID=UPI0010ABC228|nr:glycosyltransferase family 2 protein [Desulfosediminicola flagellatus]